MPDPWRNRKTVRICSVIDIFFAVIVITIYVLRIMLDSKQEDGSPRGFFRPNENYYLTFSLWVTAFCINVIQFIFAFLLFLVTRKGKNEPENTIQKTRIWLGLSNALFVMLISKLIYFVFFDKGKHTVIRVLILLFCLAELFFKGYAMYFVKDFRDDLKAAFSSGASKAQFIGVINTTGNKNTTSEV